MNAVGKFAGNFPEMKNSTKIIIIFIRDFPEIMKSSRNENQALHSIDPTLGMNNQQSIHPKTTDHAWIEQIYHQHEKIKSLVLSHFGTVSIDSRFKTISKQ